MQILKDEQFSPSCLELEITENEFVSNSNDHLAQLKRLAQSGITIAIDDFGSGYASIQYIKKLPVNKIKLDKSFIDNLPYSETDSVIVKATIDMAHTLKLGVIAEGIETKEQLQALIEMGCDDGQGYLFSKPLTPEVIAQFVKSG